MRISGRKRSGLKIVIVALGMMVASSAMAVMADPASANQVSLKGKPPAGFVKVSDALKNPAMAFVAGLGTLYVDPKTLPAGPFLGYDKQGDLVNVTYMIPWAALEKNQSWPTLGTSVGGLKVDHTEVHVSGPHPGVMERHIHVINWLISDAEKDKRLGQYPHLH
jgi:hypothetical protein